MFACIVSWRKDLAARLISWKKGPFALLHNEQPIVT